ncbi:TonB-dependent receptor [Ramlibacter albus]|uniref:TonB-dependent receptor n=1 Tax=Ramlibacter albus TaxID=2079448 RepID=A0A923MAG3_9BURK|nr:TonB-dependent receptor [Ramlibacter albus]MBC5765896.1 TonB-dependent receptor [Ramlibacter albus]
MHNRNLRGAIGAALAAVAGGALAQPALPTVTVTGNPLGTGDVIAPVNQLSGPELLLRSQSTLGETLANTPGVSSTYFGPNASRPVVRGLDGDRIRVLNNGGASTDASSVSYDHAVATDPIAVERIEVLRGPAALLYGGNAIGGAVNVIDNRIPREAIQGVSGKADLGWASANHERSAAALVEGGTSKFALHADAFDRSGGDVRVPVDLPCTRRGVTTVVRRMCNSAAHASGAAAGGSLLFDKGYLGLSARTYRNDYGTVAQDEVTIGMRSNRYALEGELRGLGGWLQSAKLQAGHTDYRHTEFEAGVPGTVFRNNGSDLRVELKHAKLGALGGVVGLQAEGNRFSADGAEAFAPYSRTRQRAMYVYEELGTGWGKVSLGGRYEQVDVDSLGHPALARFAPEQRRFTPASIAAGALWRFAPQWEFTANLAHSERAPKDYELYANGPHVATGAWEIGNASAGIEKSLNVDAGVQWKSGHDTVRFNAFQTRFSNYIALLGTGNTLLTDDGEPLPEFAYTPVRARFRGVELSGNKRLLEAGTVLDLQLRADAVRATNLTTGEPLPRIAPLRVGATLVASRGPWGARIGFDTHARQDRVPPGDRPTAGYTLWNAALTYRMNAGPASLLWYARVDNAGDRLAYSATSILTQTAPGRAPLPGRNLKLGLQAGF